MPDTIEALFAQHHDAVQGAIKRQGDELRAQIEKIGADVDAVTAKMAGMVAAGGGPDWAAQPVGAAPVNPKALRKELNAVAKFVRSGNETDLGEIKALSIGSDPDGGYLVTPAISQTINQKLFDQTAMRQLARVETIVAGDRWEEPFDFSDIDAVWVGERQSRPETTGPKFGKLSIPVAEEYALIPVTQRLLDDTGYDLGAYLENRATEKFARTEGLAYVTGDGVEKPRGFLTYPTSTASDASRPVGTLQYVPSGDGSGFASSNPADVLKTLVWSLRSPYRKGASFLMNSNTASAIDKLVDVQGRYLWREALTDGAPPMLLGYPVVFDDVSMPDIGSNAFPIAFGNFQRGYVIADKIGIRLLRDPFTSKPSVLFFWYRRTGGGLQNSEAIKLLKIATS